MKFAWDYTQILSNLTQNFYAKLFLVKHFSKHNEATKLPPHFYGTLHFFLQNFTHVFDIKLYFNSSNWSLFNSYTQSNSSRQNHFESNADCIASPEIFWTPTPIPTPTPVLKPVSESSSFRSPILIPKKKFMFSKSVWNPVGKMNRQVANNTNRSYMSSLVFNSSTIENISIFSTVLPLSNPELAIQLMGKTTRIRYRKYTNILSQPEH